jgi:hypothetical protein
VSGGAQVEVGLEPFNLDGTGSTTSWQSATMAQNGEGVTTWSYTLPDQLEGFYQLKLQGEDVEGNTDPASTVWQGAVDTTAPRVTVSAKQRYGGSLATTEWTLSADDLFVDPGRLVIPCNSPTVTLRYHDTLQRVNGMNVVCDTTGHIPQAGIAVCDYADNCTTRQVKPTASTDTGAIRIDTPVNTVTLGSAAITIGGLAYAQDGIQQIELRVNGDLVSTLNYPTHPSETSWEADWSPLEAGTYTLVATVTSASGSVSDTHTVSVAADTDAPAPPVIAQIQSDSGTSGDGITNDPTLVVSGTAEANSTVTLTREDVGVIGTTAADAAGSWSVDSTSTSLPDGRYSFTATATDGASNTSAASAPFVVTVDTTAPTTTLGDAGDPRTTALDRITITFSEPVTGMDLTDIRLTRDGETVSLNSATMRGTGASYTLDNLIDLTVAQGTYRLTLNGAGAGITDGAGNSMVDSMSETWVMKDTPSSFALYLPLVTR